MADPKQNVDQRENHQGGVKSSPYSFLVPGAFKVKTTIDPNPEKVELYEDVVFNKNDLYDRMARNSQNQDAGVVRGVDLENVNPVLQRSIRTRDPILDRNITVDLSGSNFRPQEFNQGSVISSQVANSLRAVSDLRNADRVDEIIKNLQEAKEKLDDKLPDGTSVREARIRGAQANLESYRKEFSILSNPGNVGLAVISEAVKHGYSQLHYLGKITDFAFGWKIFEAPPTSLMDENQKRIQEVKKEIEYHQSILDKSEKASKAVDQSLKEIVDLQNQLRTENDPSKLITIAAEIKEKIEAATKQLVTGFNSDDPELKAEWDKMRKSVTEGLNNLSVQLTHAETALHATEKGLIIAGAIGASVATGGASLGIAGGILAGTGVAATASAAQGIGHLAGHAIINGEVSSDQIKSEVKEFGSDVKDGFLYATGNGAASLVLGKLSGAVLSNGGQIASFSAKQALNNLARNPLSLKIWKEAGVKSFQTTSNLGKGVAGGSVRALITEAPAAFVDTTYALYYDPKSLDPSGSLAERGLDQQTIFVRDRDGDLAVNAVWLRALSIRLGSAMTGGALSSGFQPLRSFINRSIGPAAQAEASVVAANAVNNLKKPLIERLTTFVSTVPKDLKAMPAKIVSDPIGSARRTVARAASEIVTVPEIGLDAYGSIYTEAVIRGWYGDKSGFASPELFEQALVSSISGHISGRMQQTLNNQYVDMKQAQAAIHADNFQRLNNQQAERVGLDPGPEVVTSLGSGFDVTMASTANSQNAVGYNLGARDGLADLRASQLEHRVVGETAKDLDHRLGGRVKTLVEAGNNQVSAVLRDGSNGVGRALGLAEERSNAISALESNIERRAAGLAMLGERPTNGDAAALADYAQRLNEHVGRFNNEISGRNDARPTSIVDRIYAFGESVLSPFGNQHKKLVIEGKPNELERSVLTIAADAVDPVLQGSKGFIKNVGSIASGIGIGLFSLPSPSYYGSWGIYAGGLYGGTQVALSAGKTVLMSLGGGAVFAARAAGLDSVFYNRGSGEGAANMLARSEEGAILLAELRALHQENPSLVDVNTINRLTQETDQAARLFQKANTRNGGIFGFGFRALERVSNTTFLKAVPRSKDSNLEKISTDPLRRLESQGRIISDDSIEGVRRTVQDVFRESRNLGLLTAATHAGQMFVREVTDVRIDLQRFQELKNSVLGDQSPLSVERKEKFRNDAIRDIDEKLTNLDADHKDRPKYELMKEILSDVVDPIVRLRSQTDLLNVVERNNVVEVVVERAGTRAKYAFELDPKEARFKRFLKRVESLSASERSDAVRKLAEQEVKSKLLELEDGKSLRPKYLLIVDILRSNESKVNKLPENQLTQAQKKLLIDSLTARSERDIAISKDFDYSKRIITELLSARDNFSARERVVFQQRINQAIDQRLSDKKLSKDSREKLEKFKQELNNDDLKLISSNSERLIGLQNRLITSELNLKIKPQIEALSRKLLNATPEDSASVRNEIYGLIRKEVAESNYLLDQSQIQNVVHRILSDIRNLNRVSHIEKEAILKTPEGQRLLKSVQATPKDFAKKKLLGELLVEIVELPPRFTPKDKGDFLATQWGKNLSGMIKNVELLAIAEAWKNATISEKKVLKRNADLIIRKLEIGRAEVEYAASEVKNALEHIFDPNSYGPSNLMNTILKASRGVAYDDLNLDNNQPLGFLLKEVFGSDLKLAYEVMSPTHERFPVVEKYIMAFLNRKFISTDAGEVQSASRLSAAIAELASVQGDYQAPKKISDKELLNFSRTMANKILIEESLDKKIQNLSPEKIELIARLVEHDGVAARTQIDENSPLRTIELRLMRWEDMSGTLKDLLANSDPQNPTRDGLTDFLNGIERNFGRRMAQKLLSDEINRIRYLSDDARRAERNLSLVKVLRAYDSADQLPRDIVELLNEIKANIRKDDVASELKLQIDRVNDIIEEKNIAAGRDPKFNILRTADFENYNSRKPLSDNLKNYLEILKEQLSQSNNRTRDWFETIADLQNSAVRETNALIERESRVNGNLLARARALLAELGNRERNN